MAKEERRPLDEAEREETNERVKNLKGEVEDMEIELERLNWDFDKGIDFQSRQLKKRTKSSIQGHVANLDLSKRIITECEDQLKKGVVIKEPKVVEG